MRSEPFVLHACLDRLDEHHDDDDLQNDAPRKLRRIHDGVADCVYRPGAPPLAVAEVRRYLGLPLTIEKVDDKMTITKIELTVNVSGAKLDKAGFDRIVEDTRNGCPVSRALKAVPISVQATLA